MTIAITFDTAENCAAFAKEANITVAAGDTSMDIPWTKLALAKKNTHITNFTQNDDSVVEFIIGCNVDPTTLGKPLTVLEDLGNNFYHISSSAGLELHSLVTSLDAVEVTSLAFHANQSTVDNVNSSANTTDPTTAAAQWARIRVASTTRPLNSSLTYYTSDELTVKSTPEVIIIDSGINWSHQEFANVAHEDLWKLSDAADFSDARGHGTLMASAVAGANVGLARSVKLVNVKIANDTRLANLVELGQAINAILDKVAADPSKTYIVNASWGTPYNSYLEHKFQQLLDAGVTVVTAAGNDGVDVANITPAGMTDVITVGASDKYDIPAGFNNIAPSDSGVTSNFGQKLDLFAPGVDVVLADSGTTDHYLTVSGTSASAAYVTGAVAEVASLMTAPVTSPTLLNLITASATRQVLLFDDTQFTTNQNKLLSLVTANKSIDAYEKDLYVGLQKPEGLTVNVNYSVELGHYRVTFPENVVTKTIEMGEGSAAYAEYISMADDGKNAVISPAPDSLLGDEKIKIVKFKIKFSSDNLNIYSPSFFYAHANSSNTTDETQQALEAQWPGGGAVTLALMQGCGGYYFKP